MFDNAMRLSTDLNADKSKGCVPEYERSFPLPQLMMIQAMPSGVSWLNPTCHQPIDSAVPIYLFRKLMHALKHRITHKHIS